MRLRVQKKMMRKRVKGKERVNRKKEKKSVKRKKESEKKIESKKNERKKKQACFYAKASDVKSTFLYKPAYICTIVQRGMF